MVKRNTNPWIVYTDVFSLVLMTILLMLCMALLIPPTIQKAEKDFHPKAEYMVVLDWNDGRDVDLDLWLKNPEGTLIFYRMREASNISLDRDSRGKISNRSMVNGVPVDSSNEEIMTIRAIVPGDYQVGVSYYSGDREPVDYTVKIIKINPKLTVIKEIKQRINSVKEIERVATFHIDEDGSITELPLTDEPFLPPGSIP